LSLITGTNIEAIKISSTQAISFFPGSSEIGLKIKTHSTPGSGLLIEDSSGNEKFEVRSNGDVNIGTSVSPTGTSGKVLSFGDNVGNPIMGANVAGIFGRDVASTVHMFVIDEADNATQISPHDPDTGEWIFYSENKQTGKRVRVDLERFFRERFPEYMVEDIPGKVEK